jgi:hypothetical protein
MQQCIEGGAPLGNSSSTHRRWKSSGLGLENKPQENSGHGSRTAYGTDVIQPAKFVRDLVVLLDHAGADTCKQRINQVTRAYFFQLRPLKQICLLLGPGVTVNLMST